MPMTKTATRLLRSRLLSALTFPHGTERYVELIDPLASRRDVRAEVTAVHRQTPRSVTLTLAPNENWAGARAGQFVGLGVEIDGRRETRPYSPSGSEHAAGGVLEFTVSTHPDGLVSRHLRDHAEPGMIVHLDQAAGEFVLPEPAARARVAGERGQRHHARHGDAAHALRRGLRRRDRLPELRPLARARAVRRRARRPDGRPSRAVAWRVASPRPPAARSRVAFAASTSRRSWPTTRARPPSSAARPR